MSYQFLSIWLIWKLIWTRILAQSNINYITCTLVSLKLFEYIRDIFLRQVTAEDLCFVKIPNRLVKVGMWLVLHLMVEAVVNLTRLLITLEFQPFKTGLKKSCIMIP